jgi:Glyoxalase-like domain
MLMSVMCLTSGFSVPAFCADGSAQSPPKLDHILLWGRNIDEVTSILAVKLGFQVRPGHDPGGVANRYVRFSDRGYLELLGITRSDPDMDPGMSADQALLHGGAGSHSFGIYAASLDQIRTKLLQKGLPVTSLFTAPVANLNQQGSPEHAPPDWRLFAFEHSPLSSSLFFIDYAPGYALSTSIADDQIVRTHPNGARALSAVWLLSSDADADRVQLAKLGFDHGRPIHMPEISARGYCVPVSSTYILALEPDGPGTSADALSKGGPQVFGVSIAVSDLARAQRWVERGYQQQLKQYEGPLGTSFLAPTQADLGMFIEFESMARGAGHPGCDNHNAHREYDRRGP